MCPVGGAERSLSASKRFVLALRTQRMIRDSENNIPTVKILVRCVHALFHNFPTPVSPLVNGPFRIKWNWLLLSHQRKVVDTAEDSWKARKECENVDSIDLLITPTQTF